MIGLENENESKAAFLYDPVGRLLQETGFDGLVTRYQYDQYSGRLGVLPRFPDALPDPLALVDSYIADEVDQDACQALARQWQAKLAGGHAVKHFHSEQARGFPADCRGELPTGESDSARTFPRFRTEADALGCRGGALFANENLNH
ncbi:RHS repeat domain-containing protein [Pantoea sp. Cy-639]|uniref:RHS repeat domain-containing protein n=1 Tax=Pantoea sp. Cy-639 TaxID=2608360 RepID=UPI002570295A|nr:RHS repeat domain-containing protein [Pantoea sp. Cy-639]